MNILGVAIHRKQFVYDLRKAYLDLMISTLAGTLYEDPPLAASGSTTYNPKLRAHGWDWPSKAVTMIGTKRLENIRMLLKAVIKEGIPGDFVETGVWRGGACIMARAVLMAYGVTDRKVVVCDSFEGLPEPDKQKFPADANSNFHTYEDLAVSEEAVRSNFEKFGLLDGQVQFIKGFFRDTMKLVTSPKIAVLRLDGDMYESTIQPLDALYDRIPNGGWVIVDDYHVVESARSAVHDFLDKRRIKVNLQPIDGIGAYFRKGEQVI